jgi:hypothetical protein
MNLMAGIVSRMGKDVIPCAPAIVAPLAQIWQGCDNQNLLRGSILKLMAELVSALEHQAAQLQSIVVPMIGQSTNIASSDEVYLMEDGLELWLMVMQHAPQYTEEVHNLFPNLAAAIERDFDNLKPIMTLVESYVLLGQQSFAQTHAGHIQHIFTRVVGNVKPRGAVLVARAMECVLCVYGANGVALLESTLGTLLDACIESTQSPPDYSSDVVLCGYLSVLAFVLFHHADQFMALVQSRAATMTAQRQQAVTVDQILVPLVGLFLDKFDHVGGSLQEAWYSRRKLWAAGLCSLLSSGDQQLLQRTGEVLDMCVDVLTEIEDKDYVRPAPGSLSGDTNGDTQPTSEAARKAAVTVLISTCNLREYVQTQMAQCSAKIGADNFQQLLTTVDSSTLQQLQKPSPTGGSS